MRAAIRNRLGAGMAMMFLAVPLMGGPGGLIPIVNLIQQADLVVVGDIVGGSSYRSQGTMEVSVIRAMKGPTEPFNVLVVQWQEPGNLSSKPYPVPRHTGLFFIRAAGAGLTALPVMQGASDGSDLYITVPSGTLPAVYAYPASAAPGDKVTAELAAAMEGSGVGGHAAARGSADYFAGMVYLEALESIQSPNLVSAYQRLAVSAFPDTAALGIAGMVRHGDPAALRKANAESNTLAKSPNFGQLQMSISDYYRNTSPEGVAALTELANNPSTSGPLRWSIVYALRAIHTKESLPALVRFLDSSDQRVRYSAVFGLASFANNLPVHVLGNTPNLGYLESAGGSPFTTAETRAHMPSLATFQSDEQRYLIFWKQWWVQVQGKL